MTTDSQLSGSDKTSATAPRNPAHHHSSTRHNTPQQTAPRAAYIHVPFCVHRCGYCDFSVVAGRDDLVTRYLAALEAELALLDGPHECDTVFIGGGTPTYLDANALRRLLAAVRKTFPLAKHAEWSIEANPFGLTDDRLDLLAEVGVNRISLGVQAFDNAILKTLERDHSAANASEAVRRCQTRFANTSLDLIFGVPGQSLATWQSTLTQAIDLGVPHVSCYGLTIEKGTSFWTRRSKGDLVETDDSFQRDMYTLAMDMLPAAGLEQYELSNYGQPGFESRHNANYWAGGEFFGVGPGAASLVGGVRRTNHRSTTTWLKRIESGLSATMDEEPFDAVVRGEELLMTGLRRTTGLSFDEFEHATRLDLRVLANDVIAKCVDAQWLEADNTRIRLTREGRYVADTVIAEFFTALD